MGAKKKSSLEIFELRKYPRKIHILLVKNRKVLHLHETAKNPEHSSGLSLKSKSERYRSNTSRRRALGNMFSNLKEAPKSKKTLSRERAEWSTQRTPRWCTTKRTRKTKGEYPLISLSCDGYAVAIVVAAESRHPTRCVLWQITKLISSLHLAEYALKNV